MQNMDLDPELFGIYRAKLCEIYRALIVWDIALNGARFNDLNCVEFSKLNCVGFSELNCVGFSKLNSVGFCELIVWYLAS